MARSTLPRKKRAKPSRPEEIARRRLARLNGAPGCVPNASSSDDPEMWGLNVEALAAQSVGSDAMVAVVEPTREVKHRRAYRMDCFRWLKNRDKLTPRQYLTVERFQEDLAVRYGKDGVHFAATAFDDRPFHSSHPFTSSALTISDRSMLAALRLEAIKVVVIPTCWALMERLCLASIFDDLHGSFWPGIVFKVTGYTDRDDQVDAITLAVESIGVGYSLLDAGDLNHLTTKKDWRNIRYAVVPANGHRPQAA